MSKPTLFVDGDACPVKAECAEIAGRYGVETIIVANAGLRPSRDPLVSHVLVGNAFDAADDWIVEHLTANDVVVTADVPLANRVVSEGAHAVGPTGREFTPDSVGMALAMRNLGQHLRETGESRGLNAPFSTKDRSTFKVVLDRVLGRAVRQADLPDGAP